MQSALILALAALSTALPQKRAEAPLSDKEFGLLMRVGGGSSATNVSLKALDDPNNAGSVFLVSNGAASPSYDGIVAYLNGTGPDYALNLDLGRGPYYGVYVPDVGSSEGVVDSASATSGQQQFEFETGADHAIEHVLTSADQMWFSCNRTIGDYTGLVLSWGTAFQNGTYPDGCTPSQLYQDCDVYNSVGC